MLLREMTAVDPRFSLWMTTGRRKEVLVNRTSTRAAILPLPPKSQQVATRFGLAHWHTTHDRVCCDISLLRVRVELGLKKDTIKIQWEDRDTRARPGHQTLTGRSALKKVMFFYALIRKMSRFRTSRRDWKPGFTAWAGCLSIR